MKPIALLLALALLAGCSAGQAKLAKPDGQVFRFNPDRWNEALATQQATAEVRR